MDLAAYLKCDSAGLRVLPFVVPKTTVPPHSPRALRFSESGDTYHRVGAPGGHGKASEPTQRFRPAHKQSLESERT